MFQLECLEGSCKGPPRCYTSERNPWPAQVSSCTAIGEASSVGIMACNREVWNASENCKEQSSRRASDAGDVGSNFVIV